MTKEEAIRMLTRLKDQINFEWADAQKKMDALNVAIEALKQTEWIPCSERLPEEYTDVLATTVWGDITIAERLDDSSWFIIEGYSNANDEDIVAWQELPEPWKGDEE